MDTNLPLKRIKEIRQYLKKEVVENFPKYQLIELDTPPQLYKERSDKIHKELKKVLSNQEKDKEYYYVIVNENAIDLGDKIVYSNNKQHVIYEIQTSRFSFFDEKYNYIGDVLSKNEVEYEVNGKNFGIARDFDFKLKFETSQFRQIALSISKDNENMFEISAFGKNKIKTIKFDNQKKQIKAEVVNSFIKNIIFDLSGNVQSVGIKNKISKELSLKKTQFDVNNYSDLIKAVESELEVYNLMNDNNIDIMNQSIFDSQITLVRNLIAYKHNIHNDIIYKNTDSIKEFFNNINIKPSHLKCCLNDSEEFEKYKIDTIAYENCDYDYSKQTLSVLALLKLKNIDFNYFLNETVLNSFKELNVFADAFKDLFKEDVKNKKIKKLKV